MPYLGLRSLFPIVFSHRSLHFMNKLVFLAPVRRFPTIIDDKTRRFSREAVRNTCMYACCTGCDVQQQAPALVERVEQHAPGPGERVAPAGPG